jgi:geranylgeranylglycerol-phosphate geranylgeranyltransferase
VNPYFRLVRIHNVLGAAFGAFTGYVVGVGWEIRPLSLVEALLVVSLVAAGGYSINDVYDLEIDRINKPDRPLPSGAISLRRATYLSYSLMGLGVMIAVIQGGAQAAVALLTAAALVLYARDLKKTLYHLPGKG